MWGPLKITDCFHASWLAVVVAKSVPPSLCALSHVM